jgi:hypothetical protein
MKAVNLLASARYDAAPFGQDKNDSETSLMAGRNAFFLSPEW